MSNAPVLYGAEGQVISTEQGQPRAPAKPPMDPRVRGLLCEVFGLITECGLEKWGGPDGKEQMEATIVGVIIEMVGKATLEKFHNIDIDLSAMLGPGGAAETKES